MVASDGISGVGLYENKYFFGVQKSKDELSHTRTHTEYTDKGCTVILNPLWRCQRKLTACVLQGRMPGKASSGYRIFSTIFKQLQKTFQ